MTKLVVGGPVAGRDWILPTYFKYIYAACESAHLDPEFVFVVPEWDESTQAVLEDVWLDQGCKMDIILVKEPPLPESRDWGHARVQHMVDLRTTLLRRVRQIGPKYFWSLDSDVLPSPDYLTYTLETFEKYNCSVVGGHLYMSMVGRHHSSKGFLDSGGHHTTRLVHETELGGVYVTDIVMGSFVAAPTAYWVDYQFHQEGEDNGWAMACRKAGLKFMWDARALAKHVMSPGMLNKIDPRVGF